MVLQSTTWLTYLSIIPCFNCRNNDMMCCSVVGAVWKGRRSRMKVVTQSLELNSLHKKWGEASNIWAIVTCEGAKRRKRSGIGLYYCCTAFDGGSVGWRTGKLKLFSGNMHFVLISTLFFLSLSFHKYSVYALQRQTNKIPRPLQPPGATCQNKCC